MKHNRPNYEPMVYSSAVNVSPEHLEMLNQAQLPKKPWRIGRMLEEPVGLHVPGRGYLIRIAVQFGNGICVDPGTGEVLWMPGLTWPFPTAAPQLDLVNSSLQQLTSTQQAIMDAFPFAEGVSESINALDIDDEERIAAEERDIEQRAATAMRLREHFRAIDPAAMTTTSHWQNFTMDVEIGDFSMFTLDYD